MIKVIFIVILINYFVFSYCLPVSAKDKKNSYEQKQREIEKALFMVAGSQHRVLEIGLVDCVVYALKNNSEILVKRIEPKLKDTDIRIARADFEPVFSADYALRDSAKRTASELSGADVARSRDIDFSAGISGKLPPGTEYGLDFISERYKSNSAFQSINPYYSSEPRITITQPLFRGFGALVNTADIAIARNNKQASEQAFGETVAEIITETKIAYFNYFYYLENYAIARLSLERAKDLLGINKSRYSKGLLSSVDLLETETAVAQREKALLSAESNLKKAEDELKLITSLVDDPDVWNARIELIDNPGFNPQQPDLLNSLQSAFKFRPDYQTARIDLNNRDIRISTAKNSLLPTVDLTASFGLNGLGGDYADAISGIDSDYKNWSIGVKFSLPWGGRDRAEYDQRKLEKAQALIEFKRLEQNIILQVRDKVREVDIQYRQVEAAAISKEKEIKNYEAQKERYAAGQASTHDMLDYQDRLAQAELDYIKALIDYNSAIIRLDEVEGLTLVKNDIKLEE